ncbi:GH19637, partial [Drosophila grimshawi]
VELENWVNSIHSACAAAFARHRGKTGTLHLLQEEIFRLEKAIESVSECQQHTPNHSTCRVEIVVATPVEHTLSMCVCIWMCILT